MASRKPKDRSLPKERQKTDKSLRVEREKVDEKLASGTERTEERTDEEMVESRVDADTARRRQRAKADQAVDAAQEDGEDSADAKRVASELRDERRSDDEALEAERRSVDAALEHERERQARTVQELLRSERGSTDRDLTHERDSADTAVRRAVSMRSENAAALTATRSALLTRDDFLAIIGHDLKNPLVAIATAAESLKSESSDTGTSERVRTQTDTIATNARDALRLLNDLLERVAIWQDSAAPQDSAADAKRQGAAAPEGSNPGGATR